VVVVVKNVRNNKNQYINNSTSIIGLRRRLFLTIDVLYLYYSTVQYVYIHFVFLLFSSSSFLLFSCFFLLRAYSSNLFFRLLLVVWWRVVFVDVPTIFHAFLAVIYAYDDVVVQLFFSFLSTYECGPSLLLLSFCVVYKIVVCVLVAGSGGVC